MFFDLNSLNRIDRKRGGRNVVVRICSLLESVENTSSCTFEGRRFIMVSWEMKEHAVARSMGANYLKELTFASEMWDQKEKISVTVGHR